MRRAFLSNLALGGILFILYLTSAILGLKVHAVSGFATLVWLPTGLSLAFLFLKGIRFWPAIFLAAFAANFYTGAPFMAAVGIGIGNTVEAVVGANLLKTNVRFDPALKRVNDVIGLIFFAALFSTFFSATIGVTSLWLANVVSTSEYSSTWFSWWAGDVISNLVIAPLIFVWSARIIFNRNIKYLAELSALLLSMVIGSELIFGNLALGLGANRPRTYLIFPPLIWAAMRFGPRIAVSSVFLYSAIATWNTAHNLGPFTSSSPADNLLNLQTNTAVVAVTTMILAAAFAERKLYEQKKDEFISVASHELKTPITSVKTLIQTAETLFARKGDKQSSELLERADRQVDRLNRLVTKLLDVSRIQEGRVALQKTRFDLPELIKEIAQEAEDGNSHKVIVKCKKKMLVTADRDRIGRVLTNLLSNAIKFSPSSEKIIIKASREPKTIIVGVQDFGQGIAKDDREKIFDRYYQVDLKKHKKETSLGLGLYISKEIVELHGGTIWVESKTAGKNKGSTFYFTLPAKK